MLTFLVKHSLVGMFICALLGFLFPSASNFVFPALPVVLFCLMLLTLLGMPIRRLTKRLVNQSVWLYGLVHSVLFMCIFAFVCWLVGASNELTLAILGVGATGSLFATPAIVRALGFDNLEAMAMTIATTLMLPIVLYFPIQWLHVAQGQLDFVAYGLRLLVFIVGPILISILLHRFLPSEWLQRTLVKISPYTILLVFAFPFGLVGAYRQLWQEDELTALLYLLIAALLVAVFFLVTLMLYRKQGYDVALTAAITAGNRNVLLTYSIAGALLGPAFLPLAGAMQLPTYLLPVITKRIYLSHIKYKLVDKCK